jgi:predicted enzyme related to lactoylglutathione lyase
MIMASQEGNFVWYELMTNDPAAAEAFYKKVNGWTTEVFGGPDSKYTILNAGGVGIGGLMELPEEARKNGARPAWVGYVHVEDVDAKADEVKKKGGAVHRAPDDIPGVGRFAVVADPQGAAFLLFKNAGGPDRPAVAPGTPGHVGWHELHATERESAFAFYAGLFGWTKGEAHDMGPVGVYQLFATGGLPVGGMMTKMEGMPRPFWLYYFNVDSIDAAVGRVTDAGGKVMNGPQQVPGGIWIAQCTDSQGAMFALVGPRV